MQSEATIESKQKEIKINIFVTIKTCIPLGQFLKSTFKSYIYRNAFIESE